MKREKAKERVGAGHHGESDKAKDGSERMKRGDCTKEKSEIKSLRLRGNDREKEVRKSRGFVRLRKRAVIHCARLSVESVGITDSATDDKESKGSRLHRRRHILKRGSNHICGM